MKAAGQHGIQKALVEPIRTLQNLQTFRHLVDVAEALQLAYPFQAQDQATYKLVLQKVPDKVASFSIPSFKLCFIFNADEPWRTSLVPGAGWSFSTTIWCTSQPRRVQGMLSVKASPLKQSTCQIQAPSVYKFYARPRGARSLDRKVAFHFYADLHAFFSCLSFCVAKKEHFPRTCRFIMDSTSRTASDGAP